MKKFLTISISILTVCLILVPPIFVSAATGGTITYQPLAPIPALGITNSMTLGGDSSLVTYLNSIVKMMISLATGLAVLYLVYAGIQYSLTDSVSSKGQAKSTIWRVLGGLLLALTSYLILNTINPALLTGRISGLQNLGVGAVGGGAQGQDFGIVAVPGESGGGTPSGSVTGPTRSATFNGQQITYFGGMEDVRTDANGNVINPNGGTTWNESASVASSAAGRTVYLRDYDPSTQYYSAHPLADKAASLGLPVFSDTGTGNVQLSNYYLAFDNRSSGGNLVYTEIIDRGPGNPNASLDASRRTLSSLGGTASNPTVYLVDKQGNTVGIQQ